jgi:hypothetical protein
VLEKIIPQISSLIKDKQYFILIEKSNLHFFFCLMNTDYQQQIAQPVHEEKDYELTENAPKQHISSASSSSSNLIGINPNDNYQDSDNNMKILTTIERRERILTLLIIAFIALLTGKILRLILFE